MKAQLGSRLPSFTDAEIALVKGSNDFYGMNTYTANYIRHLSTPPPADDFLGNLETLFEDVHGTSIGEETQSVWLRPNPHGFYVLLKWISSRYSHPAIFVTENGTSIKSENDMRMPEILEDDFRVKYFDGYVRAMAKAVDEGVDVKGYLAWSLMDNFEWAEGYETRFGVTYVDYEGGQKRYPKKSAKALGPLFQELIKKA